jgi:hypothetical protein
MFIQQKYKKYMRIYLNMRIYEKEIHEKKGFMRKRVL